MTTDVDINNSKRRNHPNIIIRNDEKTEDQMNEIWMENNRIHLIKAQKS